MDAFSNKGALAAMISVTQRENLLYSAAGAFQENGLRAKLHGLFHRHGGMDAKFPCFITACGYHPPVAAAANNKWLAFQGRVIEYLHFHKKCVEVKMCDDPLWIRP